MIWPLLFWVGELVALLRAHRCALCRVRCETLVHCRFGHVCAKCQDAVFRLYHYRTPRLSDEQARRIMGKLFDSEGWQNG